MPWCLITGISSVKSHLMVFLITPMLGLRKVYRKVLKEPASCVRALPFSSGVLAEQVTRENVPRKSHNRNLKVLFELYLHVQLPSLSD